MSCGRRAFGPWRIGALIVLASMFVVLAGCRSALLREGAEPGAALAIEVDLELKGLVQGESARGRLWLRLMPEKGGVARECALEWWSEEGGKIALSPSGVGPEGALAWFPALSPGRYRLSSFVVVARIDGSNGGGARSFKVVGRLEPSVGFSLEAGELRFPGRLELRLGVDRTYVFGFSPRSLSSPLRRALARAAGVSGLKLRVQPPERIEQTRASGHGEPDHASRVEAPRRPAVRSKGALAAAFGERMPSLPPGDAVLGVRLRLAGRLAERERAVGTLRIVVRSLSHAELQSAELGWAIAGGQARASLFGAAAQPLGDRGEVLLALGLEPGAYELRAIDVDGRVDGPAGRAYVEVQSEVPGLPVFEVRPGVLRDLGTLAIGIEGRRATLRFSNTGARAASGGGERARALSALARALGGDGLSVEGVVPVSPNRPEVERRARTSR